MRHNERRRPERAGQPASGPPRGAPKRTFVPVNFDPDLCIGCNLCVDVCQVDIMLPNPTQGSAPLVFYPEECWYDGSCVAACPIPGAITLNPMEKDSVRFLRKETGEEFFT